MFGDNINKEPSNWAQDAEGSVEGKRVLPTAIAVGCEFPRLSQGTHTTKSADCERTAVATCTAKNNFEYGFRRRSLSILGTEPQPGLRIIVNTVDLTKRCLLMWTNSALRIQVFSLSREVERLVRQKYPQATFLNRDLMKLCAGRRRHARSLAKPWP